MGAARHKGRSQATPVPCKGAAPHAVAGKVTKSVTGTAGTLQTLKLALCLQLSQPIQRALPPNPAFFVVRWLQPTLAGCAAHPDHPAPTAAASEACSPTTSHLENHPSNLRCPAFHSQSPFCSLPLQGLPALPPVPADEGCLSFSPARAATAACKAPASDKGKHRIDKAATIRPGEAAVAIVRHEGNAALSPPRQPIACVRTTAAYPAR